MCDVRFLLGCVFLRWDFDPFLCVLWYAEKYWGRNIIVCMVDYYNSNDFLNYLHSKYLCALWYSLLGLIPNPCSFI
jgi:hypothetical protein